METLVIVRQNNYWGAGKDVSEAKANYRKASGRAATSAAVISEMVGTPEDLERVTIDDFDGTIRGPSTVQKK
jgi:hypothetical protein